MDTNTIPSASKKGWAGLLRTIHLDSQTLLLFGVFIVLAIFFAVTEDRFLTGRSISSMAFQLPELGVLALAMMITILTGGINLSVNASSNLAAVVAGLFLVKMIPPGASPGLAGFYVAAALGLALLVGLLCGVINGFLIGYIRVPAILATLATLTFFTGISTGLTGGATVTGFPEQLAVIGAEDVFWVPMPFVIFVLLTIFTYLLLNQTTFGFKARMLGSNPIASNFSGIDNKSILMKVYIISGVLSAITGILIMSRTMSAAYEYGTTTYVLLTILIAVLASILPGFGNVIDIFIAVIILQILSTGFHMVLLGIRGSSFFKDFSWGVLLILIFIINYFTRVRKKQE
jgi:simple sugar transport system permease protein